MRGRVDAHVRHETGQHGFLYAERFELRVEIDLNKRIGLVLVITASPAIGATYAEIAPISACAS